MRSMQNINIFLLNKSAVMFVLLTGFLFVNVERVWADWTLLPESRHHLFQTYGLFIDMQNIVIGRGQNHYWAAVAANMPLAGNNDSPWHPQIIFHLSGNDSMHVNDGGGVFTETLDTRIGFFFECTTPIWDIRAYIGIHHISGHTVDGTDDPSLGPLDLGDNTMRTRFVRDFMDQFRVGLDANFVINAIPDNVAHSLEEFAEYFPLGSREDPRGIAPFVAVGYRHPMGSLTGHATIHAQAGVSVGSHFGAKHSHDMRMIIGYYDGQDPRSKYSQYDPARNRFTYLGIMFNM